MLGITVSLKMYISANNYFSFRLSRISIHFGVTCPPCCMHVSVWLNMFKHFFFFNPSFLGALSYSKLSLSRWNQSLTFSFFYCVWTSCPFPTTVPFTLNTCLQILNRRVTHSFVFLFSFSFFFLRFASVSSLIDYDRWLANDYRI